MNVQCALGCLYSSSGVGQVVGVIGVDDQLNRSFGPKDSCNIITHVGEMNRIRTGHWITMKVFLLERKSLCFRNDSLHCGIFAANSCSSFIQG